jgi:hypothetical protein
MTKGKPILDTSNMVEGQHKRREREANPMDIVARLHKWPDMTPHACIEAANEIERLRKHIEELGSPSTMHQNFMARQAALESALRTAEENESNLRRLVEHLNADIKALSDNSVEIAALRTAVRALGIIDAALAGERGERVRHKTRGTTYRILTQGGKLQTSKPLADMAQLVIYQCEQTGELWARPYSEFMDGRFEPFPPKDAAHE